VCVCVCVCVYVPRQYITRHCKSRQYRQCARPYERTSRNVICGTPSERDNSGLYQNSTPLRSLLKFESPESDAVPRRGCARGRDNIATSRFSSASGTKRASVSRLMSARILSRRAFARRPERRGIALRHARIMRASLNA
jgi:hypothetical protein